MPIFVDDLITSTEVEVEQIQRAYDKAGAEIKYIIAAAREQGRPSLSQEEDERVQELFNARERYKADKQGAERKLENVKRQKAQELEDERAQAETGPNPALPRGDAHPGYDGRGMPARRTAELSVGRNERTYRPDTDKKGVRFLSDVSRAFLFNDPEANYRLGEHMREERIERGAKYFERAAGDSTTANWAGLTVPQYLTDMYAPAVAALRPFADICNKHDLPPNGMTVNISLVTTPAQVGAQPTGELNAVVAQSIDDTLLTENVQTAAGQVTLSRQAIDRGTGIEEVTMQDLFRRYATNLDSTLVNQATTGLSALGVANNYTGSTIQALYSKILGATAGVEGALLAQATPSHVVMYSSRWWWMAAQVGTNFPFINVMGPQFPWQGGAMDPQASYSTGVRGRLPSGLAVVSDNNVPNNLGAGTNQDEIYVVAADECHLWEDPDAPVFIRAEQPKAAQLGVLLVLYGYFAYTFRRYANAIQKVSGTGLTTPAF